MCPAVNLTVMDRFICLSFLLLAIDCSREICFPAHFEVPSLECPQEPARPLWGSPALFEARSLRCRLRTSTLWDRSLAHLKVPRTFTLTGPFVHPDGIGQSPVGTVRSSLCLSLYIAVIDCFIFLKPAKSITEADSNVSTLHLYREGVSMLF